jgi:hypothetical protein
MTRRRRSRAGPSTRRSQKSTTPWDDFNEQVKTLEVLA